LEDPLIKQVIEMMRSPAFRAEVNNLAGYDSTDTGKIQTLSEAFKKTTSKSEGKSPDQLGKN
jgi:hypothetical protein